MNWQQIVDKVLKEAGITLIVVITISLVGCGKPVPQFAKLDHSECTNPDGNSNNGKTNCGHGNDDKDKDKDNEDTTKASPSPTPSPVAHASTCTATTPIFLDVRSLSYIIVSNPDGSTDVSCSVTNNTGLVSGSTSHYDSTMTADKQFSTCKIYYENSHNIVFNVGGNYDPQKPIENVMTQGWEIVGIPNQPQNGYQYSWTTCVQS